MVTTGWGARLTVFAEDSSHFGDFLESGVSWPLETEILLDLVDEGMTVLDVGANFGYHTSLFAARVGERGRVVAMEPEPAMAAMLDRNVEANGYRNVSTIRAAAGAVDGVAELWCSTTNFACHSLNRDLVPAVARSVTVPVITLDGLYARNPGFRAPDLVKIDVEGWESEVLIGARATLLTHRPVLWLEFWPDGLRRNGRSPEQLLLDLTAARYDLTMVDLVSGETDVVRGAEPVDVCDRQAARYRAEGRDDLYGIVYLLAVPND
ncbi:hypothetical protein ALI22I_09590 [Saccharothrix sp. ALI-22-I]|uniref:FkbM family methyltransferase n=1 Tax=Saccharothrix sp. ALI-22-I TaxID=1933778 RepID=UPI00097BAE16|nr:FkbM family methyltransferase [Saccharothrix sp. ALI-22-I]ONI91302.1 hypothetical protein ALI22I_09590 [Saccharothrix sp. ALI-22-I]